MNKKEWEKVDYVTSDPGQMLHNKNDYVSD